MEILVYDGIVNIIEECFDFGICFGDIFEGGVVVCLLMKLFCEGLYVFFVYFVEYGVFVMFVDFYYYWLIGYCFIINNCILLLIFNDYGE